MLPQSHISIFETLKRDLGDRLNAVALTKATLVHLSHTLEDFVIRRHLPALIFTGFQESSHWREETKRYRALAEVAMEICIFAGKPFPPEEDVSALQIQLDGDDPLRQEWFLAILSTEFTVILAGLDNMESTVANEAYRRFETVWSFDVDLVNRVLDSLERVIATYRPSLLASLQQARRTYPPVEPKFEIIVKFTKELIRFEDNLQHQIYQTAQELKLSEAHYRSVVSHAPVTVLSVSADGVLQMIQDNPRRPLFAGQLVAPGEHVSTLYELLPTLERLYAQAQTSHTTYDVLETPRGSFDVHTNAIKDDNDTLHTIIIMFVDVTERQRITQSQQEQDRLRLSLEKEQEVSKIRRQLMVTLSHELRTPLAAIQTSSDLLMRYFERLEPAKRQERITNIQYQVKHLKHVLDDINAVIRNEDAPFGQEVQAIDVGQIAAEVIDEISNTTGRKVMFVSSGVLKHLHFDPRMIRYIISNLTSNAIKYSVAGRPVICKVVRQSGEVMIRVQDYGIGIPLEEQDAVLQPFYRASNVGDVGGSGLGLSIIHNMVEAIGGSINIESAPGVGTTVTVMLPLQLPT